MLKSPLFDHDDDDLIRLAPHRKGSLFSELLRSNEPKDKEAAGCILDWGKDARSLGPYRFYAKILGAGGGRKKNSEASWHEAATPLTSSCAWRWDRRTHASGIVNRLSAENAERGNRSEARHGGGRRFRTRDDGSCCEGPRKRKIVFSRYDRQALRQHDPKLIELDLPNVGNVPVWRRRTKDDPDAVNAEVSRLPQTRKANIGVSLCRDDARGRTALCLGVSWRKRAAEWLLVPNVRSSSRKPSPKRSTRLECICGPGKSSSHRRDFPAGCANRARSADAGRCLLLRGSSWLPAELRRTPPLRPSRALAAPTRSMSKLAADRDAGWLMLEGRLGTALHQHLPDIDPASGPYAAGRFPHCAGQRNRRDSSWRAGARRARAQRTMRSLRLCSGRRRGLKLPSPGESPCGGAHIESTGASQAAESEDAVLIADFKTGAPSQGGKIPSQYLVQMALYRASLQPLFPENWFAPC